MPSMPLSPRSRAADDIVDHFIGEIRSGRLYAGAFLPAERALMARFGVSRTVAREAVSSLAAQGLVTLRPGFRPVVARRDPASTLESMGRIVEHLVSDAAGAHTLYDSRVFFESALARYAATHANAGDIADLRKALADNAAAIGQAERFYETDVAFHAVLYRIPGNPIFPALHRAYVDWLQRPWSAMPISVEIDRTNHDAHAAVLAAIAAHDGDGAEAALRQHLQNAWELVRRAF